MNKYQVPKEKPVYNYVKESKIKKPIIYIMLDRLLTVYGFLLVFAYTIILLLTSLQWKLSSIAIFVIFWLMLTYIAFPRLHSFFANMYLPDYFFARTKTGDGILGDPVNLGVLGSEEDIHAAMRKAGWVKADPITLKTSIGIAVSTIKHTPYPAAPVSDLYLFNRKQDFAYQMEVDGSASRRHHVRFWKVPEGWILPGGHKVEWLAAGTFDKGVGLTSSTLQITHKIDKHIDKERDFIIDSVLYVDNDITVDVIENFSIPYTDQNGGGDRVETDGHMPIVDFTGAAKRNAVSVKEELESVKETKEDKALNTELPPRSLIFIGIFVIFKLVISIIGVVSLLYIMGGSYTEQEFVTFMTFLLFGIGGGINLILYIFTLKKYKWSRLLFTIIVSVSSTFEIADLFITPNLGFAKLLSAGISLAIVLILSSLDIRQWVYTVQKRGE